MKFLVLIIALMTLSACDKINHMMDIRMEKMASVMDATVVGINDQRVMLPFQQLMDEANYKRLSPITSQLMPWAQKFAQASRQNISLS